MQFDSRDGRAGAVVRAVSEAEGAFRVSSQIEPIRVFEDTRIVVRRVQAERNQLAFAEALAANLEG